MQEHCANLLTLIYYSSNWLAYCCEKKITQKTLYLWQKKDERIKEIKSPQSMYTLIFSLAVEHVGFNV